MLTKRLLISASLAASAAAFAPGAALASSHREAPLLLEDPSVDATDLYAFRNAANVVLVANYIPMELPAGGPNFSRFSDNAVYRINVDNNGDAVADIVYEFRFRTQVTNPNTFLYNTGVIATATPPNVRQFMTVTRVAGATSTVVAMDVEVAPAYVGRHSFAGFSTPNPAAPRGDGTAADATADAAYDSYVTANSVRPLTGIAGSQVFAGPRDDPFFVDLGSIFDLLRIRPGPPGNVGGGVDYVAGFNVHSIVLEVPMTDLLRSGAAGTDPMMASSILGIWTTAHRPRVRVLRGSTGEEHHGQLVQVSRLGNPLINEALVPLAFKNFYLGSQPATDVMNFGAAVMNNEVTNLLNALYFDTITMTHADPAMVGNVLVGVLTGFNAGITPADLLHLNVAVPSNPFPAAGSRATLGALGMDGAGYPNGRRLADDVTDIELRVLSGALSDRMASPVNSQVGDGVNQNDAAFTSTFPYLARPHEGYSAAGYDIAPTTAVR